MSKTETRLAKRVPGASPDQVHVLGLRSDADHIAAYINGEVASLTPALSEKLRKLERVADLISRHGNPRLVAPHLVKLWPGECCLATAYNWIAEAQEIFTPQHAPDRAFWVETLIGNVMKTRAKAEVAQDLKVMAACDKNLATIIEKFMGTNESMPIDKIQPPRMVIGFYPGQAGVQLPDNYQEIVQRIIKTRQVGAVADAADNADIEDAQVLDETQHPGTP